MEEEEGGGWLFPVRLLYFLGTEENLKPAMERVQASKEGGTVGRMEVVKKEGKAGRWLRYYHFNFYIFQRI